MQKKPFVKAEYEEKTVRADKIETPFVEMSENELKDRTAYFLLEGAPLLSLNEKEYGTYELLSDEKDFLAAKAGGMTEFTARVYRFSERDFGVYKRVFRLKKDLPAMEEAHLMRELIDEYGFTQEKISRATGKSRPAIANTLRLLSLEPEVIGLVESGRLSAGHARALVKVPKDKQYPFAMETVERGCSVRETERAVKAFLTPPEILQSEKEAKAAAKNAELKALVERARDILRMKVSLIGNDKKGRLYIDYQSAEELYRFEEFLGIIENFYSK